MFLVTTAQNRPAEVFLKNGTVLKGLGKLTASNQVRFRTSRKSEKQLFSFADVDTLKVFYDNEPTVYVCVKVKDRKETMVLEVSQSGKNVVLYTLESQGYMVSPMGAGGMPMGGSFYSISNSYVRKTDEEEAAHLGSNQLFTKNFKKAAANYFNDCPQLVQKITSKELKKRDLGEIIKFYNESCD
ncbi:hypothetical protein ACFSQJ_02695 [Croceitalea marina]|uniref:Uncharacterized protein n=1 Tax=Croceitalea marina TaxID=1775166 RepID=A0ABW5MS69_9FLAO